MPLALGEAALLLGATDGEPQLDEVHTAAHEVTFELRCLAHELRVPTLEDAQRTAANDRTRVVELIEEAMQPAPMTEEA